MVVTQGCLHMNLNVINRKGRTYLFINKSYRDENGKAKKKHIQSIGYVDELEKQYPDPIAHFRGVARKMTEEEKAERQVSFTVSMDECLPIGATGAKNLGYALPLKIYHRLGLDKFFKGRALSGNFEYNTNSIMILLIMARLLMPGSKKAAFEAKDRFFERFDFTLDDIYRSLGHFDKISNELQRYMYESVRANYGSDTSIIYYDCTNYYFEIKKPDDFRKFGLSKEKRKRPIVQMGLAMDKNGIPLHYELFRGNMTDKETFRSVIGDVRKNYDTGRVVVVADMGIITGDNIYYLVGENADKPRNGYIFSFSVSGGTDAFKRYVLEETGYTDKNGKPPTNETGFKIKERRTPREINVTMQNGKTKKKTVHEKQVVFWSRKHAERARAERAEIIAKAEALVANPERYTKATSYGAASYVGNIEYDKETGEVTGKHLFLDIAKIEEQEKYDGYYSIVTSELSMPRDEVVTKYRGLWEIEETFKLTKSDLEARPVHVQSKEHINAHFLSCFIALTILRLIQKQTNKEFSGEKIIDCLNKIECINEHENIYLFGYRSQLSDRLGEAFEIDFSKKRLVRSEIKKISAEQKKVK
jgi:transposase